MAIDLYTSGTEISQKAAKIMSPLVTNPFVTAILIVTLLVLFVLMLHDGGGKSLAKVAFWSFLAVIIILTFHDNIIAQKKKAAIEGAFQEYVNVPLPESLNNGVALQPNISSQGNSPLAEQNTMCSMGSMNNGQPLQPKKRFAMPNLSVNRGTTMTYRV